MWTMTSARKKNDAIRNLRHAIDFFLKRKEGVTLNEISGRAVATAIGVTEGTVRGWFKDVKPSMPRVDKFANVAAKLECDVWQLLHPDIKAHLDDQAAMNQLLRDRGAREATPSELKELEALRAKVAQMENRAIEERVR